MYSPLAGLEIRLSHQQQATHTGAMSDTDNMSPHMLEPTSPTGMVRPSLMVGIKPAYILCITNQLCTTVSHEHSSATAQRTHNHRHLDHASNISPIQHHNISVHSPSLLTSLNLAINTEFHFLVCQLCKEGITTSMARGHVINKHPELLGAFHQEQLDKVASKLQLAPTLPTSISGLRPIVHDLAVHNVLTCRQCQTVLTKPKNMRYHQLHHHPNNAIPDKWRAYKAQRMKAEGAGSQQVIAEEETGIHNSDEAMTARLMKELSEQLKNIQAPTNHQLVSPWLCTTRWHEYVAGHGISTNNLHCSIGLPQSNELKYKDLHVIVEDYFQEALALIESTDELVLQSKLTRPGQGISIFTINTPLHKLMLKP